MRFAPIVMVALVLGPGSAAAQQADTRYTLERTADGYVRMDLRTGEMSICTERDGQLLCRLAADERDAWQDEIARLSERLDEIERRLEQLDRAAPAAGLPSDEEFEKGLSMMERFVRRFLGVVKDLEAEGSPPQKT